MRFFFSLSRDRRGAVAIEYALIAALIALAAIVGFKSLGTKQGQQWNNVQNAM